MTIRRRLFVSNILMVVVPTCLSILIGSLCVGVIWYVIEHGTGTGFEDSEDFSSASKKLGQRIVRALEDPSPSFDDLEKKFRRRSLTVVVTKDGKSYYRYGESLEEDATLLGAVASLGGEGLISKEQRNLYAFSSGAYQILLFGSNSPLSNRVLLFVSIVTIFLLVLTGFISIFFTDRFLMRFVFRRIEEPLDILAEGVRQIQEGNLSYRIVYDQTDEFLPLCNAFNAMTARLRLSVEQRNQDEKSRKELIAGISHDIRSPLTSIQAYVEGLLDNIADSDEARTLYLTTIKDKAEDINRLVTQLFLFSKLEMDEFNVPLEQTRLDEVIATWLAKNGQPYKERGLTITGECVPFSLMMNKEQFSRILDNIADNSLKYKTKQQGELHIILKGRKLFLFDDGPCVPDEDLPHLKELFYRSDHSRRAPDKGSGLGLAIVSKIVEHMGGKMHASKGPLGGLMITIMFQGRNACPVS